MIIPVVVSGPPRPPPILQHPPLPPPRAYMLMYNHTNLTDCYLHIFTVVLLGSAYRTCLFTNVTLILGN
jgi:hypothetical protein